MNNKIYVAIKKSRCFIEATVGKIKKTDDNDWSFQWLRQKFLRFQFLPILGSPEQPS